MPKCLCFMLLIFAISAPALAQGEWAGRDEAFQLKAYARIASHSEEAANLYADASEALEEGNLFFAKLAFKDVLDQAPAADDAMRGLARVEYLWDNFEDAEGWARQALGIRESMENRAQLAFVLLAFGEEERNGEALELVRNAPEESPNELWPNYSLFLAAHRVGDVEALKAASARMVEIAPEFGAPHFFHGQFLAKAGDWDAAELSLGRAAELGVAEEEIALAMLKLELGEKMRVQRSARGLIWFGMLVALVGVGILLTLKIWFERRRPE
ncbi:hypothetical protein H8E52_05670 [bacterium]|nr:hypothetical protein [bacterium]